MLGFSFSSTTTLASSYKSCGSDAYRTAEESASKSSNVKRQLFTSEDSMKKSTSGTALDQLNEPSRYLRKNVSMQDFSSQQRGDFGRRDVHQDSSVLSTGTITSSHTLVASTESSDFVVRESGSDLVVLENPSKITQPRLVEDCAVIRESGSDLVILQNPKVRTLKQSMKNQSLERSAVVRESGSDLLILANPSTSELGHKLGHQVGHQRQSSAPVNALKVTESSTVTDTKNSGNFRKPKWKAISTTKQ